ncbi:response regulator [Paractinoplanes globisporus]|uniref:Response regulator transcription factor n=1 Tax=Paractinoplanes globisporus TaxID=113565 RepID=A0ABW6W3Z8_9ACTN|nr:response regulator transcription factor [Actinoplanes globisporus]
MTARRRVVVVDDHEPFRALVRELLQSAGYEVVGEAGDGEQAVGACTRLRPDVVLLDVQLPGMDGFAVADRLAALDGPPVVVLISNRDVRAYRRRLLASPVRGFIHKPELSAAALAAMLD